MNIGGEMIVWVEPIERKYLHLISGDIQRAITWFKKKKKQEPKLIALHPYNEKFASEVDNEI